MENTLKELLAEVESINEKLERIEKHTKPIDLKADVTAKLDEIKAKKDNQIQEETIMAKETKVTYEIKAVVIKEAIKLVEQIKEAHRESHDVLEIKVTNH